MNPFFLRLLASLSAELRDIAGQHTDANSEEYDVFIDAADAIEDARDLLEDMLRDDA